jgi:FkbM family methyltransferase
MQKNIIEILRRFKWWVIDDVISAALSFLIRCLPDFFLVRVIENLKSFGRLDYGRGEILMELMSVSQLGRLKSCRKEPGTVEWFTSDINHGDVIFDIGANVGAYSLIAAKECGSKLSVYAFEPSPATYAALINNIRINELSSVIKAFPIAFSDRKVIGEFNQSSVAAGAAEHAFGEPVNMYGDRFNPVFKHSVLSYSIDAFVREFDCPVPSHIKIDVDGLELSILQGATEILSSARCKRLLIEVAEGGSEEAELLAVLNSFGFELCGRDSLTTSGFKNFSFKKN